VPQDPTARESTARESTARHAFFVAAGILVSRIVGLVRQGVFSKYFGLSDAGDAFNAAFRVPNLLQNLFGEGVLSASFIPVYAKLLAQGDEEESGRVAGAVGAILALVASMLVLAGIAATPYLIFAIAPGYEGAKRELTIRLVRVLFPGAGLLVFSAWCLGILNSHRKFFLSYTAPVIWNLTMIATIVVNRGADRGRLAFALAWGSVIGSALQFGVQLPAVLSLARRLQFRLEGHSRHVREVLRNFGPVFISRGVVQISAYIDQMLASLLGEGAMSALSNVQSMYTLPVSLFGMSISAAELPAMSGTLGDEAQVADTLRRRLSAGLRRIAFFVVPSSMAFFVLGDTITAVLYERGAFTHRDTMYVWGVLAGSAVGLLASTQARLYASTFYALRDTRTPLRYAIVRVALTTLLGFLCAVPLPRLLGLDPHWGAAGLTASAGAAGWIEFAMLRASLGERIGAAGVPPGLLVRLWSAALIAAAAGWTLKPAVYARGTVVSAAVVLGAYGTIYFAATYAMRVEECVELARRVIGRLR
jgi:putative peptidoglycan lipid II flippase